ncbi:MAG: phosphoribosylaminoimidazolesuccinocarboxamide synthase [Candidatus Liptonbacteria bacterium]|nr:phosphoribosylaminoimidazolesuccinocarboxamide synthase [Candidatus Liptonbacteria bacterium]
MSKIPANLQGKQLPGLTMISQGKVRDTHALPDENLLLPVATDRVSIFDFVLPAEVPQKGEVLTALNIFWFSQLAEHFPQDVIAFGSGIDKYLPEISQDNAGLWKRAIVVKKLNIITVEAIVRDYLTGSGWGAYMKTAPNHVVCGHSLLPGFKDGDRLPEPIFTPTTKAAEGHDEHMDVEDVRKRFGAKMESSSVLLFQLASEIALKRGIVLADTKLEFGIDTETKKLVLGDERFTPDSSRFWLLDDWKKSREEGRSPISFDKQFVREWGKTVSIDKLNPLYEEHVEYVHSLTMPQEVLAQTRQLYRYIFYLLTGMRLETFQREKMSIPTPSLSVEIVLGSKSDLEQIRGGLDELNNKHVPFRIHVVSCHRNPEELRKYAESMVLENATIIAAAGKAAALPGMLQAWLRYYGKEHIPVVGVGLKGKNSEENAAATLSIEQIPGNPVVLKENNTAFYGPIGFLDACKAANTKEFFIPPSTPKEAHFNLISWG